MVVWSQVNTGRDEATMLKNSPFMLEIPIMLLVYPYLCTCSELTIQ